MPRYFHYHIPLQGRYYDEPLVTMQCKQIKDNHQRCKKRVQMGLPYCFIHLKYKHHLQIKQSLIPNSGQGVFVIDLSKGPNDTIFRKNEVICQYNGEITTVDELTKRYGIFTGPYALRLHHGLYEDAGTHRGIGSMINHKPMRQCNCRLSISRNNKGQIVATKDIRNNSELYINYGDDYKFNEANIATSTNNKKLGV